MIDTFEEETPDVDRIVLTTNKEYWYDCGDWDYYLHFPSASEEERLSVILGVDTCDLMERDFHDIDIYIKCQEERDTIIKRLINEIVNDFDSKLNIATEADIELLLHNHHLIEESAEAMRIYEQSFKTQFSNRFPKVKLRLDIQTIGDGEFSINACCSVRVLYTFYKICPIGSGRNKQLIEWEQPNNHVEGHGHSYQSIEDACYQHELMKEYLHKFNNAPLYANWLTSQELVNVAEGLSDASMMDASVYNSKDALEYAISALLDDYGRDFYVCEEAYFVIYIGAAFESKSELFKTAKRTIREALWVRGFYWINQLNIGIAYDPDLIGGADLTLYSFS